MVAVGRGFRWFSWLCGNCGEDSSDLIFLYVLLLLLSSPTHTHAHTRSLISSALYMSPAVPDPGDLSAVRAGRRRRHRRRGRLHHHLLRRQWRRLLRPHGVRGEPINLLLELVNNRLSHRGRPTLEFCNSLNELLLSFDHRLNSCGLLNLWFGSPETTQQHYSIVQVS